MVWPLLLLVHKIFTKWLVLRSRTIQVAFDWEQALNCHPLKVILCIASSLSNAAVQWNDCRLQHNPQIYSDQVICYHWTKLGLPVFTAMTNTLGSTLTQEEYLSFMMFGEGGNAADYRSVINTTMNELMNGILLQTVSLYYFVTSTPPRVWWG